MVVLLKERETTTYDNIDVAISEVAKIEADYKDVDGNPSENIQFSRDNVLIVNDEEMPMTKSAYSQMLGRLEIPYSYAERIDQKLLGINIRKQMREKNEKEWVVKTSLRDGQTYVRGVVTKRYSPLYDSEMLRKAKQHTEANNITLDSWEIESQENSCRMKAILPLEIAPKRKVGDITKVGISGINGTSGFSKLAINTFLYRLECLNGLVVPISIGGAKKWHVGSDFTTMMNTGFENAFGAALVVEQKWDKIYNTLISDASASKIRLVERAIESELGRAKAEELFDVEKYPTDTDTVYNLLNRITQEAHSVSDPLRRNSVEESAGKLLLAA